MTARTPLLIRSGMIELAAGALSGWAYTAVTMRPDLAARIGVANTDRIRQWHLDLIMMGTATTACGMAVAQPPRGAEIALCIGSWTNAMAFLPLAFSPGLYSNRAFLGAVTGSFAATTVGFCGLAGAALRRSRRADDRR